MKLQSRMKMTTAWLKTMTHTFTKQQSWKSKRVNLIQMSKACRDLVSMCQDSNHKSRRRTISANNHHVYLNSHKTKMVIWCNPLKTFQVLIINRNLKFQRETRISQRWVYLPPVKLMLPILSYRTVRNYLLNITSPNRQWQIRQWRIKTKHTLINSQWDLKHWMPNYYLAVKKAKRKWRFMKAQIMRILIRKEACDCRLILVTAPWLLLLQMTRRGNWSIKTSYLEKVKALGTMKNTWSKLRTKWETIKLKINLMVTNKHLDTTMYRQIWIIRLPTSCDLSESTMKC